MNKLKKQYWIARSALEIKQEITTPPDFHKDPKYFRGTKSPEVFLVKNTNYFCIQIFWFGQILSEFDVEEYVLSLHGICLELNYILYI
jgi:hypothetical protein